MKIEVIFDFWLDLANHYVSTEDIQNVARIFHQERKIHTIIQLMQLYLKACGKYSHQICNFI